MASEDSRARAKPSGEVVRLQPPRKCPVCGKDASRAHHPFCSRRCADIDLNRWLTDGYVIAAAESDKRGKTDDDD